MVLRSGVRSRGPWVPPCGRRHCTPAPAPLRGDGLPRACQKTPFTSVSWNDTEPTPPSNPSTRPAVKQ